MQQNSRNLINKLSMGYRFSDEREPLALVYACYFLIILFGITVILLHIVEGKELIPVSYRYHLIIGVALLVLFLMRNRMVTPARAILLLLPPFLILILPPLTGLVDDEFFFWFPYVPIAFSIIPHFILHPRRHRTVLILILGIYFLNVLFIHRLLISSSGPANEMMVGLVEANQFYYTLIPAFIFVFVNAGLALLFAKNIDYEAIMMDQRGELVQAEKMAAMGTLTAGLTHEMNNPLNFISASLQALEGLNRQWKADPDPGPEVLQQRREQMDEILGKAAEGLQRSEDIVTKLALFSNPEKQEIRETGLKELVQKAIQSVDSKIPYYISFSLDIPEELSISCRDRQIRLVFSHIISNAIDAIISKENRGRESIHISAHETDQTQEPSIELSFFNSGPPIPGTELNRIFDPFYTSREAGEGTGLGMSLSYMIIQKHGGRIKVENADAGVFFKLILPRISPDD